MDHLFIELVRSLFGENYNYITAVVILLIAGWFLIFVNVRTHARIEDRKKRLSELQLVERNLKPVIKAAGDLISRITEILVIRRSTMINDISSYDPTNIKERILNLSPLSMNRHESTAYRLINFMTVATYFGRQTAETPSFSFLDRIEFYLHHKIPVALRGNLYNLVLLSTEVQEEISASLLECDKTIKAKDLSVGQFCQYVKSGRFNHELYNAALDLFYVDISPLKDNSGIDHNDKNWQKILALSHLGVFLIDFFQSLDDNPQWEEYRVFLISLIRQWNANAKRHSYLYEDGDLDTKNYIDTYPGRMASKHAFYSVTDSVPEMLGVRRALRRFTKRWLINKRGCRFRSRHHKKVVRKWGIKVLGKNNWHPIRWDNDLNTIHADVINYLRARLTSF
ncbi:MAG: hypothetical protein HYV59_00865 [Planctomycetes bacterium]|nr:hypothetical protein [Planctomycetota bacterium]